MKKWIILMLSMPLLAQNVTIDVSPKTIGINETLNLSVTIPSDYQGQAPTLDGDSTSNEFRLLDSSPGKRSRLSIVDGNSSSSVTYTFKFHPNAKGKFTFPAQDIRFNGNLFKSQRTQVEVVDARPQPSSNFRERFRKKYGKSKAEKLQEAYESKQRDAQEKQKPDSDLNDHDPKQNLTIMNEQQNQQDVSCLGKIDTVRCKAKDWQA